MPESSAALEIYKRVYSQHIMGFSGPIALNHLAMFEWIRALGIPENDVVEVADMVIMAYNHNIRIIMDKQEEREENE